MFWRAYRQNNQVDFLITVGRLFLGKAGSGPW
jgi:hypothetical protein